MILNNTFVVAALALSRSLNVVDAQVSSARQIAQERRQAELDAPKLVEVLGLR